MSSRKNVQQSPTEVGVATDPSPEAFAAAGGGGLPDVLKLAVCAGSGVVFGFAAEKGRGKDCHWQSGYNSLVLKLVHFYHIAAL